MTRVPEIAQSLGLRELKPAGSFFVPLRAQFDNVASRSEVAEDPSAHMHSGLFDVAHLKRFDSAAEKGRKAQFDYSLSVNNNPTTAFNVLSSDKFQSVIDRAEELVHELGTRLFEGEIKAHPSKGSGEVACKNCRMLAVCRFDPWVQPYNKLTRV